MINVDGAKRRTGGREFPTANGNVLLRVDELPSQLCLVRATPS